MGRIVIVCLFVLGIVIACNSTRAADPFYVGTWKILSAVAAPWADPKQPDSSEQARLLSTTVDLSAKRISGPSHSGSGQAVPLGIDHSQHQVPGPASAMPSGA